MPVRKRGPFGTRAKGTPRAYLLDSLEAPTIGKISSCSPADRGRRVAQQEARPSAPHAKFGNRAAQPESVVGGLIREPGPRDVRGSHPSVQGVYAGMRSSRLVPENHGTFCSTPSKEHDEVSRLRCSIGRIAPLPDRQNISILEQDLLSPTFRSVSRDPKTRGYYRHLM